MTAAATNPATVSVTAARRGAVLSAGAIALPVVAIGACSGGYFSTSWGWSAALFAWYAVVTLVLCRDDVARLSAAFASAFAAFGVWIGVSVAWSTDPAQTVLALERFLVYLAAVAALLAAGRRFGASVVLAALLVAISILGAYSLATKLFPGSTVGFDAVSRNRLSAPIGYWNALGLLVDTGVILSLAFVSRAQTTVRAASAAVPVVLLPTLYFTFSRGSWAVLAIAILVALALDPQRLATCAALAAVAPAPAVAVVFASRAPALTALDAKVAGATHQGHRLALVIVALAVVASVSGGALGLIAARVVPPPAMRRALAAVVVGVIIAVCALESARYGAPWHLAQRGWHSFVAPQHDFGSNLNSRLFQVSNHGRLVQWKSALHEFRHAPLAGTGAGTFGAWWDEHRPRAIQIRNPHSLYLEALGELGIIGVVLVALVIIIPFVAAWRRRRNPLVPFAAAVWAAWAIHAGVDWDWEVPAVTLPALACAVVCTSEVGATRWAIGVKARLTIGTAVAAIAIFGLVAAIGNQALASAGAALDQQNYAKAAADSKKAARWAPWLADPWIIQGQIQALNQNPSAALADFRKAIAKDSHDYLAWYGLAGVTTGQTKKQAVTKVVQLNPLSDEAKELRGGS